MYDKYIFKILSTIYTRYKALKESWLNEQEKQLKTLTKEKEIIAAKKRQYEVLRTINTNTDNITKIEVS